MPNLSQATRLLFEEGRLLTANVAGGTHHAFRDRRVPCLIVFEEIIVRLSFMNRMN